MYITIDALNTFLETELSDDLATQYIEMAESILHSLCNVESFANETVSDERHDYNDNGPYYLKKVPTAITEVNGSAVAYTEGTDYILRGRRLEFASSITINTKNTTWDFVEFSYTSGYATIPLDLQNAVLILSAGVRAKSKAMGIQSYTQGDISVTYAQTSSLFGTSSEQHDLLTRIINKYKFIDVYSV